MMSDGTKDDGAAATVAAALTPTHDNRQQRLQNSILLELSATVNTMTSISEVLDNLEESSSSLQRKQALLLQELRQWKDVLPKR